MKLAKPKKFKKAIKVIEDYLGHSTEGITYLDEWRGEVECAREYLDPEDFGYFDGYVDQFEKKGLEMRAAWKTLIAAEAAYEKWKGEMFETIWSRMKKAK